jgi:hypothetical protein
VTARQQHICCNYSIVKNHSRRQILHSAKKRISGVEKSADLIPLVASHVSLPASPSLALACTHPFQCATTTSSSETSLPTSSYIRIFSPAGVLTLFIVRTITIAHSINSTCVVALHGSTAAVVDVPLGRLTLSPPKIPAHVEVPTCRDGGHRERVPS